MATIALIAFTICWGLIQAQLLVMAIEDTIQCRRLTFENIVAYTSVLFFAGWAFWEFVLR